MSKLELVLVMQECDLCKGDLVRLLEMGVGDTNVDKDGNLKVVLPQLAKGKEIVLRPDHNAHDVLTGWHVSIRGVSSHE